MRRVRIGVFAAIVGALVASGSAPVATAGAASKAVTPNASGLATFYKSVGFDGQAGLYAYGMDWDSTDNTILVGDYWNYRVWRYTTSGTLVGSVSQHALGGMSGGITAPYDVEADATDLNSSGKAALWVADQGSSRIVEFDHNGKWLQTIGKLDAGQASGTAWWSRMVVKVKPGRRSRKFRPPRLAGQHRALVAPDLRVRPELPAGLHLRPPRRVPGSARLERIGRGHADPARPGRGCRQHLRDRVQLTQDLRVRPVHAQDHRLDRARDRHERRARPGHRPHSPPDLHGRRILEPRLRVLVRPRQGGGGNLGPSSVVGKFANEWRNIDGTNYASGHQAFDSIRFPAVDGQGNVYVGETWGCDSFCNGTPYGYGVEKYTPGDITAKPSCNPANGGTAQTTCAGATRTPWATGPQPPPRGGFNQQNGIAIDSSNNLYVVDTFEQRVQKFNLSLTCVSAASCPAWMLQWGSREPNAPKSQGFGYPRALTYESGANRIWVGDNNNDVLTFNTDGSFVHRYGSQGKSAGQFSGGVQGIEVVGGKVYATDVGGCRLQVFDEAKLLTATASPTRRPGR